ncbi:MAG: efflux RND transporter permease subunit, partial [Lachnospiraceae bacterium]|nr:efflux RND transporter permease subunit [Lachnospiraceae bacterium]
TFIVGVSIPISVVLAIVLMYFSGITLNMISLSGLALGVGMLVDNSIVVIENIFRLKKEGMPIREAAVKGASQVFGAICASTLTTVSVFLPIVFVEGLTRTLMMDMALTIGFSLLASLVVAVTVVPAMAAKTMGNMKEKPDRFLPKIHDMYGGLMEKLLKFKVIIVVAAIAVMVGSAVLAFQKGSSLMPSMESTQMSATLTMPSGTELAETKEMSDTIIERVQQVKGVKTVGAMTGSGSMLGSLGGSSDDRTVTMYILLEEDTDRSNAAVQKEIEESTKDLDCEFVVSGSTMDMSAMGESGISIQIKGKELDELSQIANDIAKIVEETKGTKEVDNGQEDTTKELRVSVKKSKAMAYGLTVAQVYQTISDTLSEGTEATTLDTGDVEYTVNIKDGEGDTVTAENLGDFKITGTKDGKDKKVRLKKIATITEAVGPDSIQRDSQSRYMSVTADVEEDYNVTLVTEEISKKLDSYDLPSGYTIKIGGEYETVQENVSQILLMLVLAIAFMYLIMVAQFQSLKSPFIILFTIPLAFTGGFAALLLCGMDVSIIAMFGFIMLAGIIVNNGIVLVDYINQLREGGMEKKEAIITAGQTRLRPIIMTALTTILGLAFMAAGVGDGSEMMQPMAIVTIGGLIYGTLLTLIVVPCVYDLFNPVRKKKEKLEE